MSITKVEVTTKDVAIVRFSIYGVDGFQTVNALGANREKRIRSALNEMSRGIALMAENGDSNQRDTLIRAKSRLDSIIADVTQDGEFVGIAITDPVVRLLTTEKFFEEADTVYENNVKLFLDSLETMKKNKRKAYHVQQTSAEQQEQLPPIPHLYECKGGFLGDTPRYVVVSMKKFEGVAENDTTKPVRDMMYAQLYLYKNFMLSDYLRIKDEQQRSELMRRIIKLDQFIDSVPQVQAKFFTSLLSFGLEERLLNNKTKHTPGDTLTKVTQFLSIQAEQCMGDIIRAELSRTM